MSLVGCSGATGVVEEEDLELSEWVLTVMTEPGSGPATAVRGEADGLHIQGFRERIVTCGSVLLLGRRRDRAVSIEILYPPKGECEPASGWYHFSGRYPLGPGSYDVTVTDRGARFNPVIQARVSVG